MPGARPACVPAIPGVQPENWGRPNLPGAAPRPRPGAQDGADQPAAAAMPPVMMNEAADKKADTTPKPESAPKPKEKDETETERNPLYDQVFDKGKDGHIKRDKHGKKISANDPKITKTKRTAELERAKDNGMAENVSAKRALNNKLSELEKIAKNAKETRVLSDGRIRYYRNEGSSRTSGPTKDARMVTEYNPKTGQVRSWMECRDHAGKVNRVHPKKMDGQTLDAHHYPHTGKELAKLGAKK